MSDDLPGIAALGAAYIEFATHEVNGQGRTRAPPTLSSYRRAVEGFVAAVTATGKALIDLPESFIEKEWMVTQKSILQQPVQLRVRVAAVKKFTQWLSLSGVPVAPMRMPNITTPPPKKKEVTMSDLNHLADASLQADAIPSVQTYAAPAMQTAVPPPAPIRPPARPAAARVNPLAAMLPTGQFKLRVRREREMGDEPVFIGDFPADRVQLYGAIEPFLSREVAPKLAAQGISGDVTLLVCPVSPTGAEGERTRLTVMCAPAVTAPVQTITNGAVTPMPAQADLADMLTMQRRTLDEMEERMAKRLTPNDNAVQERQVANNEMDDLKRMVGQLAGSVRDLAERVESRDRSRDRDMEVERVTTPAPQAAPQLNIREVMEAVTAMSKAQQPAAPAQQPLGIMEMFKVMEGARSMFQPQNIAVDTSALEERMEDLHRQVAGAKKDDIGDMVVKFKAMKELFGLVGGETSTPKPTFMGGLGSLISKVVNDPAPLADAVERILGATAAMKNGTPPPERKPQEPVVPPQVLEGAQMLLDAESADATVLAAHEWMGLLAKSGDQTLMGVAQKLGALIRAQKETDTAVYFRQVFTHLGLGRQANPARVTKIVSDIFKRVRAANAARQAEAEGVQEEESDVSPDLTISVGNKRTNQQEESEEDTDDGSEGEGTEEVEQEGGDDEVAGDEGVEEDAAGDEGGEGGQPDDDGAAEAAGAEGDAPAVVAVNAVVEEVLDESQSSRRTRRKGRKGSRPEAVTEQVVSVVPSVVA